MTPGTTDRNAPSVGAFGRASAQWATDPYSAGSNELGTLAASTMSLAITCGTFGRGNTAGITSLFGDERGGTQMFLRFGDGGQPNNALQFITTNDTLQSATLFNTGQSYAVTARINSAGKTIWIDGKIDASNSYTDTNGIPDQSVPINYDSADATGRRGIHGVHIAVWHQRALSDAEVAMFHADPFQFLRW